MSYQTPEKSVKTSPFGTSDGAGSGSARAWTPERLAALALVSAWEIGSRTLTRIWTECANICGFLADGQNEWRAFGLTDTQCAALAESARRDMRKLAQDLDETGIRFVLPVDQEYPPHLSRTADPPGALFLRGAPLKDEIRVAVVGTRKMTDYGKRAAELIAGELAESGVAIVSGLALGVDATAHLACLETHGRAVAVLPSGVDDTSVAPRANFGLAKRILETGGTLISEQTPGTPTLPFQFLHRNRLISGLSDATVIVEADHDSGSLVTARLALEEGREVLAVPGPIFSPTSRGTNDLIRNGARPCASASDVLDALGCGSAERARQISEARNAIPVTSEEGRILDLLTQPRSADEIARLSGLSVGMTNALVSMLELKGRIISVGPRTFMKKL